MAPFGVAVAKGSGKIYVSNRGGRRPAKNDTVAPSSGTEIVTDALTGSSTTGTDHRRSIQKPGRRARRRSGWRPRP